jgi:hypothetical protein
MKRQRRRSAPRPPADQPLTGCLDGPSRTVIVEPVQAPVPTPAPNHPAPAREPAPTPERPKEPVR